MASLSVFEDKEGADKSVELAHDWVIENAATLIPNPPQVTEGLVVASELHPSAHRRSKARAPTRMRMSFIRLLSRSCRRSLD